MFSGGTSLLKAHGLIQRFSEELDFKLILSDAFLEKSPGQKRSALSAFKNGLADAWAAAGFVITGVEAGSGNGFIQIDMDYPTILDGHDALRPHIQAEISAKPTPLATGERPLASFVHQYRGLEPEITAIACVDPVETAADKLSAFCWRLLTLDRERGGGDPTIVRHLHDLAALEATASANAQFPALAEETIMADSHRGGGALEGMLPAQRMAALVEHLQSDTLYADEYARFVGGMAFATEQKFPHFRKPSGRWSGFAGRYRPNRVGTGVFPCGSCGSQKMPNEIRSLHPMAAKRGRNRQPRLPDDAILVEPGYPHN